MVSVFSPFKEMTPDEFRRVTEVTYLGVGYGTMAALRYMIPRNRGTIMQVGSALAYGGIPGMNTPQFEWVKSRLPRQPQPVPPIFQHVAFGHNASRLVGVRGYSDCGGCSVSRV